MSSDLLKEFGSSEANLWTATLCQSSENNASTDEDDFGDFEDPDNVENVTHVQSSTLPSGAFRYPVGSEWSGVQQLTANDRYLQPHTYSPTTDVHHAPSNDEDWGDFSQKSVIFDADVETTRQKKEADRTMIAQQRPEEPTTSLLHATSGTKTRTPMSPTAATTGGNGSQGSPRSTKAPLQSSKDASNRQVEATKATNSGKTTIDDDDPWVDFEAAETATPTPKLTNAPPSCVLKAAEASNLGPPPSNIPPPSILFPVVARIFKSLATDLKTLQSHNSMDQATIFSQLRALLSSIRAAARILAGRKLRWKRDNLLSQSMKIGPAHSGKAGGMKLAGVDKAESRREDQEAAEALQVWKQQAGPLRSTIAALNRQLPEHERFTIFEIADNMPIRQGKPSEGMVTAPKSCFLCGIKRDERVATVDADVEDSFGEWWVAHWGHVDCVAFWENQKDLLRQR